MAQTQTITVDVFRAIEVLPEALLEEHGSLLSFLLQSMD